MISDNIKSLRLQNKLTQAQLASKLNCTPQSISAYENGRREVDIATLEKLASIFHITIDQLIKGEISSSNVEVNEVTKKELEDIKFSNVLNDLIEKYRLSTIIYIISNFVCIFLMCLVSLIVDIKSKLYNNTSFYIDLAVILFAVIICVLVNLNLMRKKHIYSSDKVFYDLKNVSTIKEENNHTKVEIICDIIQKLSSKKLTFAMSMLFFIILYKVLFINNSRPFGIRVIILFVINVHFLTLLKKSCLLYTNLKIEDKEKYINNYLLNKFIIQKILVTILIFIVFVIMNSKIHTTLTLIPLPVIFLQLLYLIYLAIGNKKISSTLDMSLKITIFRSKTYYLGYFIYYWCLSILTRVTNTEIFYLIFMNLIIIYIISYFSSLILNEKLSSNIYE